MSTQEYKYTRIADLKEGDRDVNIYGIVKYFSKPTITIKNDWNVIYTIIDPSVGDDLESGIRCNLFARSLHELPRVKKVGDIIRFHRMVVKIFRGRLQMQGCKKSSSWLVVYPHSEGLLENVYDFYHPNYTFNDKDNDHVRQLQLFLKEIADCLVEYPKQITLLKDITLDMYMNFIVQIVRIYTFTEEPNHYVLKVTDGSKVSYNSFRQAGLISNVCSTELLEATKNHSFEISLFDEHGKGAADYKVGQYIEMRNVHLKSVSKSVLLQCKTKLQLEEIKNHIGWVEMIMHPGKTYNRGISVVKDDNKNVKEIQERVSSLLDEYRLHIAEIKQKNSNVVDPISRQESLSSTDFPLQPFMPIEAIVGQKAANNFRLRGKLIMVKPSEIERFVVYACNNCSEFFDVNDIKNNNEISYECSKCKDDVFILTYFFELLIEDDTGIISVEVYGKDAVYFLNNITPLQFISDDALMSNIKMKFESVFNNNPSNLSYLDSLPSIEVCISSFTGENNNGIIYRVFGTSLI